MTVDAVVWLAWGWAMLEAIGYLAARIVEESEWKRLHHVYAEVNEDQERWR